jgi:toxin FitB
VIILDTNVVSEPMRPEPSDVVRRWIASQSRDELYTTAITEAEMRAGIALMPAGKRRAALAEQVHGIFGETFSGRILPFDSSAAREIPAIVSTKRGRGMAMIEADAQIAAIARAHGAILATRNLKDFEGCGVHLVDPWKTAQ